MQPWPRAIGIIAVALVTSDRISDGRSSRETAISGFSKSDRSVLAESLAEGRSGVVLNIASRPAQNPRVASQLIALGATVRFREDAVDYLSAVVPIDRAETVSRWPEVEFVAVDMVFFRMLDIESPTPQQPPAARIRGRRFPAPGPTTPRENAFLPTRDIGAPQFIAAYPTFDGRGVTIAVVDTGVDVLTPELQTATTLDGKPTRKIVDWLTPTRPLDPQLPRAYPGNLVIGFGGPFIDSTWVNMREEVTAAADAVEHYGTRYRVPAPGRYRIGRFDERMPGSLLATTPPNSYFLKADVNLDGNPPGSSGLFALLWDEQTNDVWIDTNQNHSFVDERRMTDYAVRFDIGIFGEEDPETAARDTVPFVIETDRNAKFVNVGVVHGPHGNMVAGTAAGRGFFEGAFDGVAPGAQLVSMTVDVNTYDHNLIECLILAAQHPKVDISSYDVGDATALTDDRSVWATIVNRLIDRYGKPVVVAAGNFGPGMTTVAQNGAANRTIGVGAYVGKETWLANFGAGVESEDYVPTFSSRGPRGDGALKPDVVAPTFGVASTPGVFEGVNRLGHYPLPPGYRIGGGTSQAAPMVSGALALLVSAARQQSLPADPERLKLALINGARYLSDYSAYEQGSGLVQVGAAWEALRKLKDLPPRFVSEGPVRTPLSGGFVRAHRGPGLYERDGWSAGQRGTRVITVTRTSGPAAPVAFDLKWKGNDGTFESRPAVTMPLNVPVDVPVTITPFTSGVHSAILQIVDRTSSLVAHQLATTIVAADDLATAAWSIITQNGRAPRPGHRSHFFRVPAGVPVFNVAVRIGSGTLKFSIFDAAGRNVDSNTSFNSTGYQAAGSEWSRAFERPEPGVWEVVVENSQDAERIDRSFPNPLPPTDYVITASLLGVQTSQMASRDGAPAIEIGVTNRLAPFTGGLKGSSLGTERVERITLSREQAQRVFEIDVPAGTERLIAGIDSASDRGADLDVYVFDCTGPRCAIRAHGTRPGSSEEATIRNPAPGKWKIVVDAAALSADNTSVGYYDVILHPVYGHVETSDTVVPRAAASAWRASAIARIAARPETGRSLIGFVDVIADKVTDVERTPLGVVKPPVSLGRVTVRVP